MAKIILKKKSVYKECPNEEAHRQERLKDINDAQERWMLNYIAPVEKDEPIFCTECGEMLVERISEIEIESCSICCEPIAIGGKYCPQCGEKYDEEEKLRCVFVDNLDDEGKPRVEWVGLDSRYVIHDHRKYDIIPSEIKIEDDIPTLYYNYDNRFPVGYKPNTDKFPIE